MRRADAIREKIEAALAPTKLSVSDESHRHVGHGGWRPGGETHFRLEIVSEAFNGKTRLERHRLVNSLLAEEFAQGLHALAIDAKTLEEDTGGMNPEG